MPTSVRGSEHGAGPRHGAHGSATRGLTLIELLVVIALVAIGAGVISLSLRDGASSRLEEEGARLATLLEGARIEARTAGLAVYWVPVSQGSEGADVAGGTADFRFVGLPPSIKLPQRWLEPGVSAQVVGGASVQLGPDALLPPQRIVLSLDDRRIELATDGLVPFAVASPGRARP